MILGQSRRVGFGRSPALIVVDVGRYLTEPDSPAYIPTSKQCVEALKELLAAAREAGIPRLFTKNGKRYFTQKTLPFTDAERGSWAYKAPLHAQINDPSYWELEPELARQPDEIVIEKTKPSAFFGTPLVAYLTQLGVDTLIIGGMLTGSCVRCSVVDAFQYNYRVIVPLEGVADRNPDAHRFSLEDMDASYGDVMSVHDIIAALLRFAS